MSTLRLIAWNIRTGNKQAQAAVRDLIDEHQPHVLALSEAYSLRLPDGFCGYDVRQEAVPNARRAPWFHEPVSEYGEQATLYRPGVGVGRDRVVPMSQTWIGPVNGLEHEPRRSRRSRVVVDEQPWRLCLDHWATGGVNGRNKAAVREQIRRSRAFLAAGQHAPSVVIGDLNIGTTELARMFPHRVVAGNGPDNVIARGATVKRTVLDNFGSDHKAVLFTLSKEK